MPHIYIVSANGGAQRKLVERAVAEHTKRGYEIVRQEGGVWGDLLTENMGGGLFDERSLIIIESAEKLGDLPMSFADTLEPPDASCVLLLVCRSSRSTKTRADDDDDDVESDAHASGSDTETERSESAIPVPKALIDRCTLVKAPPIPPPWSKERDGIVIAASRPFGVKMQNDAVSILKELFDDIEELEAESAKVAQYCALLKKGNVGSEDVRDLCLPDGARDMMLLIDGICENRIDQVLTVLERLSKNEPLLRILTAVYNRFRIAMYSVIFHNDFGAISRELGAGDYAVRKAETAGRTFGRAAILRFMAGLIETAANERSGIGDGWKDMEILIIELMGN